jgi:hypothetical protein
VLANSHWRLAGDREAVRRENVMSACGRVTHRQRIPLNCPGPSSRGQPAAKRMTGIAMDNLLLALQRRAT